MPFCMMSDARSGFVFLNVSLMCTTISSQGPTSAARTSSDWMVTSFGCSVMTSWPEMIMSRSRPSSNGRMEPILILMISAVRSPILMPRRSRRCMAMASSMRLPARRSDDEVTMPPSEMTATSVVPPPMSTTMEPVGSVTGRSAPMAAAMGSSMR